MSFATTWMDLKMIQMNFVTNFLMAEQYSIPFHGSQPCHGEGVCIAQRSYEPCCAGPAKMGIIKSFDKTWPTGGGTSNHSSIRAQRKPHEQQEKAKRYRAITNRSRKNEVGVPKQEQCSAVNVSAGESKAQCCKEQYQIETCNVRSVNQGKLNIVKLEMARLTWIA